MVDEQCKASSILADPVLPSRSRSSSPRTINSKSQVRFSVPDTDFLDESQEPVLGSPSKIVFPKSFEDDSAPESSGEELGNRIHKLGNEGHFMDIHSGTMINVPEDIWNFHTRRRLTKQHRRSRSTGDQSSCNNDEELEMSKSLQSIIVDTLGSMSRSHSDKSNGINRVLPLNVRRENNYDLYLTSYSPLNSYNVPIPLEISLPPYLSPKNRGRQRATLIFDGKNYSPFNMNDEHALEEDEDYRGDLEQNSLSSRDTEEDASISANSIPPARHDISFDINSLNDVDQELGIDEYANVDLRVQRRNLKRESPPNSSSSIEMRSGILDESPLDQGSEINDINEPASPELMSRRKSLDILAAPLKQIDIPDFELNPISPISTVGSLQFFDGLGNQEEKHLKLNLETDELDMNFRFPSLPPKKDDDLIVTDNTPTDSRFQTRRDRLAEHAVPSSRGRRDTHNRSRSIHSMQDIFATSTPSPMATDTNVIFNRSTLLQNHSLQKDVRKEEERQVSSRGSRGGFAEDEYGLPFIKFDSNLPTTPSPVERNKNEHTMVPTPFSRRRRQKSTFPMPTKHYDRKADITPESLSFNKSELESDRLPIHEDAPRPKNQLSHETKGVFMVQEPFVSGSHAIYDKTDESLEIIAERNSNCGSEEIEVNEASLYPPLQETVPPVQSMSPVRPIKSIQSFTEPVMPPDNEHENIVSMHSDQLKTNYRPLSPSRSLSNSDSQSSANSQFSKQTQSSRTSYPIGLEVTKPLTGKLNDSPTGRPFSHPVDSISTGARSFKCQTMPDFGLYDVGNVSSYHQLHEETISLDHNRKDVHGQHYRIQDNSLAAKDYNESDYALLSNANFGRRFSLDNQKGLHMYHGSGNFEEEVQKYDYDDLYNESKSSPRQLGDIRYENENQHQYRTNGSFVREESYEPNNSKVLEEQRELNHTLQYAEKTQTDSVSYAQQLSPSSEFREILETLDSMISSSQRTESSPLEEPLSGSLEKAEKSKIKPITNVGYHTEYEERDGKMVEILVLDDDSRDSSRYMAEEQDSVSLKGILQSNSPSRNRKEILKMCEDTASDAKDIIFQLIDDRKFKKTSKKKFTRPPPPVAAKEMVRLLYDYHHLRTNHPSIDEERYLGNLKRAIQPRRQL